MSDNRQIAARLLDEATRTIMKDRPGVHGSAENSFQMIADIWNVRIAHIARIATAGMDGPVFTPTLTPVDVAQFMQDLKSARALYGDRTNPDNYVDDIGYGALKGMLATPDTGNGVPDYASGLAQSLDTIKPPKPVRVKAEADLAAEGIEREVAEMLRKGN